MTSGLDLPLHIWYSITPAAAPSVFLSSSSVRLFSFVSAPYILITTRSAEEPLLIVMTVMLSQLFAFVGSLDTKLMILNSATVNKAAR